jgi:hypothetical protein
MVQQICEILRNSRQVSALSWGVSIVSDMKLIHAADAIFIFLYGSINPCFTAGKIYVV